MKRFGLIGLGNMGGAIARSLAGTRLVEIVGYDPSPAMRQGCGDAVRVAESGHEVAAWADYVLLAVKPQVMQAVLADLASVLRPETCLVSIAAGVTQAQLSSWSKNLCPVVRVMPNTPAMVGKGVYALCCDHPGLSAVQRRELQDIFASIGQVHILPETLFDAYTGLIGSGPAYVYAFMEALIDAGVTLGLPRPQAMSMVKGLLAGASRMAEQDQAHPTLLKEMVTSPGGTTMAGLNALDEHGFRHAVIQAVCAATQRSIELGRE
ncbi:pyrroline-5-carboxylate reductase [Desulfovibrionales bacterium]